MASVEHVLRRPTATISFSDSGGDGRPIVFTHGAGVDHSMFDEQAAALSECGYRVITWDMREHGQSVSIRNTPFTADNARDDLLALLDECRLTRPIVVGHSLGGNLAQSLVRHHPQRVGGIIVLDATWNTGPLSAFERWALKLASPALRAVPARALPRVMARASASTATAIEKTEELFARMPKRTFIDVWKATVSLITPDPGYRTPVPLALIRGADDRTGNIATAMSRWATAEGISEQVIAGAGHMLTWDAPEATTHALLTTLDSWKT
ncbi:alpha/beta fold hydrolase [Microbacterium sp. YY-01]|uniref:alpha/beta fold hydrolase n=1 Tax=Microbacterium sp. YY-01 TaxID=3421634 RepID=UPI003D171590